MLLCFTFKRIYETCDIENTLSSTKRLLKVTTYVVLRYDIQSHISNVFSQHYFAIDICISGLKGLKIFESRKTKYSSIQEILPLNLWLVIFCFSYFLKNMFNLFILFFIHFYQYIYIGRNINRRKFSKRKQIQNHLRFRIN